MSDKDFSALQPLVEKAGDDSSKIGQTSRAAMLIIGLILGGVGIYDAVGPEVCDVPRETVSVCIDNVDGAPSDYLFMGVGSILAARLKIKRKTGGGDSKNG